MNGEVEGGSAPRPADGGDGAGEGLRPQPARPPLLPPGVAALLAAGLLLVALGLTRGLWQRPGGGGPGSWRGSVLTAPLPRPDFVLTDTDGRPFHFARDTRGKAVLLFFGYTSCPDVCPVHMANIAAVLRDLRPEVSARFQVVFVSTDPERDTPEKIRAWLDAFDSRFIGLRGPVDEVNRIQQELGLPASIRQELEGGGYLVGHASQVIAFWPDGPARVVYPFGTRQEDWAHDLPRLARGEAP